MNGQKDALRIGISLRIVNAENYFEPRDALSHDWIMFLEKLNLKPILIPNNLKDVIKYVSDLDLDGIILSGGDDIGKTPKRDYTEKQIIKFCIENMIPMFGVCRGMQVINNYFSGELSIDNDLEHVNKSHLVNIINSDFNLISNKLSIDVNSYHKNIIKSKNLGSNLIPFGEAENDGTVEGFFHKTYPIIAVMWHPERERKQHDEILLGKFIKNGKFWK